MPPPPLEGIRVLERAGPLLGEHSVEVLRQIGRSEDEVRAFVARGTVAAA
jgi:crotonobetainyl-CoA:carnitine CoA-transferase CaiB-like acyl-CoA transferase